MAACLLIPVPAMYKRHGTEGCAPPALPGPPRPHRLADRNRLGVGASGPAPTPVLPASARTTGEEARRVASKHASPLNDLFLPNPPQQGRTAPAPASPTLRPKRVFGQITPDCIPWGRRAGKAGELIFGAGLATPGPRLTN